MAMRFSCRKCGHTVSAPDDAAGKRGQCPKCGEVFTIPAPAGTEGPQGCPGCGAQVAEGAVICVQCGLNLRTGAKLETDTPIPLDGDETTSVKAFFLSRPVGRLVAQIALGTVVFVVVLFVLLHWRALRQDHSAFDAAEAEATNATNTSEGMTAYRTYLACYPEGRHAAEAKKKLAEWQDDHDFVLAENEARVAGTDFAAAKQAFDAYLAKYPEGRHIREAARRAAQEHQKILAARAQAAARKPGPTDSRTTGQTTTTRTGTTTTTTTRPPYGTTTTTGRTVLLPDGPAGEFRCMKGHDKGVVSVAVSPDGRRAVSGSIDGDIRVWDLRVGRELWLLRGHTGAVTGLAFLPNGRQVVSSGGDRDHSVRLWDVHAGRQVRLFAGHETTVSCVAVSRDGWYAVSGGLDKTVRIWRLRSSIGHRIFRGHEDAVDSVAFFPDGRFVLSGSTGFLAGLGGQTTGRDYTVRLWDVLGGTELQRFTVAGKGAHSVAFSPDGGSILAAVGTAVKGQDAARLWDRKTMRHLRTFSINGLDAAAIEFAAFSPGGRCIAGAGSAFAHGSDADDSKQTGMLVVWETNTAKELYRIADQGEDKAVRMVSYTPDGRFLVFGRDKDVCVWRLPASVVSIDPVPPPTPPSTFPRVPASRTYPPYTRSTRPRYTYPRTTTPRTSSLSSLTTPLGSYVRLYRSRKSRIDSRVPFEIKHAGERAIEDRKFQYIEGSYTAAANEMFVFVEFLAAKDGNPKFAFGDFALRFAGKRETPLGYCTELDAKFVEAAGPAVTLNKGKRGSTYVLFKILRSTTRCELMYGKQTIRVSLFGARTID